VVWRSDSGHIYPIGCAALKVPKHDLDGDRSCHGKSAIKQLSSRHVIFYEFDLPGTSTLIRRPVLRSLAAD
jgi:hypothetical protein